MDQRTGEFYLEVEGPDLAGLTQEAGGHRVMRVPPTERKGRVHTSTVTVAVMDAGVKASEVVFNDRDFRIEWYSGTGAGGQHRNKHQNSCRITHLKTSTVATAQCRSRENSLNEAKLAILTKLNEVRSVEFESTRAALRKNQVGSGERGDKVRTYRFIDNTVKDHRTGKQLPADVVMSGKFDLLW